MLKTVSPSGYAFFASQAFLFPNFILQFEGASLSSCSIVAIIEANIKAKWSRLLEGEVPTNLIEKKSAN